VSERERDVVLSDDQVYKSSGLVHMYLI